MKTYAKIESNVLRMMKRVLNITNPTNAQVAEYTDAHNYKGWTITITT